MDPLSDILSLLKPRSYLSGGLDLAGEWAVRFPAYQGIKCYALVSGQCWLQLPGIPEAVHLTAGDCFVLPRGLTFLLASDLAVPAVDPQRFHSQSARNGSVITLNGGGEFFLVGGHFLLTGGHASMLLGLLPPVVHIRKESDKVALRWSLERMGQESRASTGQLSCRTATRVSDAGPGSASTSG